MKRLGVPGLMVFVALASGCLPEKRILWSKDGRTAAVLTPEGLRLSSAEGRLSGVVVPHVRRGVWVADQQRLALAVAHEAKTARELDGLLLPGQRTQLDSAATRLREQALAFKGNWNDFHPTLQPGEGNGLMAAALLRLRDAQDAALRAHVGTEWDKLADLSATVWTVELADVQEQTARVAAPVLRTFEEIRALAVSPNGRLVAYLCQHGDQESLDLYAVDLQKPGAPRLVCAGVTFGFDWSPDSRSLAVMRASGYVPEKEGASLGAVTTLAVAGADGALLEPWGAQEELAGVLFGPMLAVKWLPDGRLIFSAAEVTLPATTADMPNQVTFFAIDPRQKATVTRLTPRSRPAPLNAPEGLFELSPDGSRALFLGDQGAKVAVYTFATGETTWLRDQPGRGDEERIVPVWRTSDEVCYLARAPEVPGEEPRDELVLRKLGGEPRPLSRTWKGEDVDTLMKGKPKPTTAPASQPAKP
ncbi:MAG: hypothetical protein U1A27_11035 [Phycisphaerae bacterium]